MKINEIPGIIIMDEAIDPEVFKAQRLAELADLAEYRRRKLGEIIAWSRMTDEERQERLAEFKKGEDEARAAVAKQAEDYAGWFTAHKPMMKLTPIVKPPLPPKKKTWFQRLKAFFTRRK